MTFGSKIPCHLAITHSTLLIHHPPFSAQVGPVVLLAPPFNGFGQPISQIYV